MAWSLSLGLMIKIAIEPDSRHRCGCCVIIMVPHYRTAVRSRHAKIDGSIDPDSRHRARCSCGCCITIKSDDSLQCRIAIVMEIITIVMQQGLIGSSRHVKIDGSVVLPSAITEHQSPLVHRLSRSRANAGGTGGAAAAAVAAAAAAVAPQPPSCRRRRSAAAAPRARTRHHRAR